MRFERLLAIPEATHAAARRVVLSIRISRWSRTSPDSEIRDPNQLRTPKSESRAGCWRGGRVRPSASGFRSGIRLQISVVKDKHAPLSYARVSKVPSFNLSARGLEAAALSICRPPPKRSERPNSSNHPYRNPPYARRRRPDGQPRDAKALANSVWRGGWAGARGWSL
jgi:hypothetical protein